MQNHAKRYDRDAALDAAMGLFWQKGYHATSLKDLQSALSMKPGSIYGAFQSKETLFGLCLERYFEYSKQTFVDATNGGGSALVSLAEFMLDHGADCGDGTAFNTCMLVKTLLNATPEDQAIRKSAARYLTEMEDAIEAVFVRAQQNNELSQDADTRRLARRYQSDLTTLKIEAERHQSPARMADAAHERADAVLALRVAPH